MPMRVGGVGVGRGRMPHARLARAGRPGEGRRERRHRVPCVYSNIDMYRHLVVCCSVSSMVVAWPPALVLVVAWPPALVVVVVVAWPP